MQWRRLCTNDDEHRCHHDDDDHPHHVGATSHHRRATTTTTTTETPSSWTVLIYVMGDTDLEPFALEDIREMAAVGSQDQLNIVALVDRHPEFADEGVLNFEDWEDTRLVLVGRDELTDIGDSIGELNLGDPATLADFIATGITTFPAEHYAVILWDHGAGWPGMGPDESDGLDVLDLADIGTGFADGLARAGVNEVDLVGFDACLMATYEVASVMAAHADYMVASQELEPGHGWDYRSLAVLAENPAASPVELGRALLEGFQEQAMASGQDEYITLSLIDLGLMDSLREDLGTFAASFAEAPQALAPVLGRVRAETLSFGRDPNPALDSNLADLGGLLNAIGASGTTLDPEALRNTLDEMVLETVSGRATADASGLSVYFPEYASDFRQGYLFLENVPHWPDLLSSFYQAGAALPVEEQPAFVNEGGEAEFFFDEDGLNMFGTLDLVAQDNLTEAIIFYGVLDESDGSIIFIGQEPGETSDDGSGFAGAIYDLTVLTMSDGIDTVSAYTDLTIDFDSDLLFFDIPLAYVPPDEFDTDDPPWDVLLSLIVDAETEDILSEVYYVVDESGTFGEMTADPEGLIYPVVLNQFPDGSDEWIVTSEVGLFADLPFLEYEFVPLDPGTLLYAELVVFDYAGNSDSISVFEAIP